MVSKAIIVSSRSRLSSNSSNSEAACVSANFQTNRCIYSNPNRHSTSGQREISKVAENARTSCWPVTSVNLFAPPSPSSGLQTDTDAESKTKQTFEPRTNVHYALNETLAYPGLREGDHISVLPSHSNSFLSLNPSFIYIHPFLSLPFSWIWSITRLKFWNLMCDLV